MNPQRILLVEDEPSIADTLIYAIEAEGLNIEHHGTLGAAEQALQSRVADLMILDVGLPDGNGFDFFRNLPQEYRPPTIFLTARNDDFDRIFGLEIGADDYVSKPFSPREVVARVKAVLRRSAVVSHPVSHPLFQVHEEKRQIRFRGKPLELSRYEYGILALLVARPGHVFSRAHIMQKVWDSPDMSLERTVDTHMKTLRQKIQSISGGESFLVTHRGVGYSIKESV